MQANPWETGSIYTNLGGLDKILLADKKIGRNSEKSHLNTLQPSIEFFSLLRDIRRKHQENLKLTLDSQLKNTYKEFYCVLSTDVLDGLISMIDFLSSHFQRIIDKRERIVEHLQKPHLGDYVCMDQAFHEDFCRFFPIIADNLSELSSALNNIEWIHNFSIRSCGLTKTLDSILSNVAYILDNLNVLTDSRDLLNEIMRTST